MRKKLKIQIILIFTLLIGIGVVAGKIQKTDNYAIKEEYIASPEEKAQLYICFLFNIADQFVQEISES